MKKNNGNKRLLIVIILIVLVALISGWYILFNGGAKTTLVVNEENVTEIVQNTIHTKESFVQEVKRKPKSMTASVPIFMYHFLLDDYGTYPDVENFMKPETFEEQLKYITENGYETIFMNEIEDLENYTKPVCLTIDDVFVYFYDNGFPLIKKYNVKVTLCIIYEYINGENYLTTEQIKEMLDSGLVSIESHTMSHEKLTTLSTEEKRRQIIKSKENLESDFGIKVNTLCYPSGDYNNEVIEIAKEAGYQYGIAMTGGTYYSYIHDDLYRIPRIYANRSMTLNEFARYLREANVEVEW
ncbi:MAG: polysaccharide deacetylase family protein [Clostridia bacterium]|nr:polysaccharide deacetylase family protein [Clostridia bacterium]